MTDFERARRALWLWMEDEIDRANQRFNEEKSAAKQRAIEHGIQMEREAWERQCAEQVRQSE